MTFRDAYSKVRRITGFVTLAASLLAIYWLSQDLYSHAGWISQVSSLEARAVCEFWIGFAFIPTLIVLFAVRGLSFLMKGQMPRLDEASWLLTWGGVAFWFLATSYHQGGPYWSAAAQEFPCSDCTIAFAGVSWLSSLNFFLIAYFFLGPFGKLSEAALAFLVMKNAEES